MVTKGERRGMPSVLHQRFISRAKGLKSKQKRLAQSSKKLEFKVHQVVEILVNIPDFPEGGTCYEPIFTKTEIHFQVDPNP